MANEEQRPNIDLGNYCAISIDTSVFRGLGYNFDHSLIKRLPELAEICRILIHDIVYREIESHLILEINQIDDKAISALNEVKRKKTNITEEQLNNVKKILNIGSESTIIRDELLKFAQETKCEILNNYDNFDVRRLITDYFNNTFPFENNSNKKNEFPDAIILHSLENYSKMKKTQQIRNYKILVISEDKGWKGFAESSEYVDYVGKLSMVFDAIYPFEIKQNIIKCIKNIFYLQPNQQYDTFFKLLVEQVDELFVSIEASCFNAEVGRVNEDYEVDLQDVMLSKQLTIDIVSIEKGKVSFVVPLILNIYVSTVFGFYHYIPHNKEYKEIALKELDFEKLFYFDVTIEFLFNESIDVKDVSMNDLIVHKVELPTDILDVDYGYVDLDLDYE